MGWPIFEKAMTAAERQRRRRARLKGLIPPWQPKGKPKPPQFDDAFLEGLRALDDLELRAFDDAFLEGLRALDDLELRAFDDA